MGDTADIKANKTEEKDKELPVCPKCGSTEIVTFIEDNRIVCWYCEGKEAKYGIC
jgi:ssDNA-binding Zn-finger/Zn-ribbon topoisomerase 1